MTHAVVLKSSPPHTPPIFLGDHACFPALSEGPWNQPCCVTKPPERGGFVTTYCRKLSLRSNGHWPTSRRAKQTKQPHLLATPKLRRDDDDHNEPEQRQRHHHQQHYHHRSDDARDRHDRCHHDGLIRLCRSWRNPSGFFTFGCLPSAAITAIETESDYAGDSAREYSAN
jgi:hypothetical protein